eukprot:scaffold6474_cov189-Amphora_coffeaeformis.AAC.7
MGAFFFLGTATAFVPQNSFAGITTVAAKLRITNVEPGRNPTFLKYGDGESEWYSPPPQESEWYSPPPTTKEEPDEEQTAKLPRGVKPKVTVIRSKDDLDKFLAEDDRLCLVKFHAAWCKSCQRFNLHFKQLAGQFADWEKDGEVVKKNSVRIAEVEWGANTQLCKSLGVTKLPSIFFYSEGMKIDSLAAGPTRFFKVREAVQRYANMTPADLQFEAKLEEGKKLMEAAARRERFEEVAKAREARRAQANSRNT